MARVTTLYRVDVYSFYMLLAVYSLHTNCMLFYMHRTKNAR